MSRILERDKLLGRKQPICLFLSDPKDRWKTQAKTLTCAPQLAQHQDEKDARGRRAEHKTNSCSLNSSCNQSKNLCESKLIWGGQNNLSSISINHQSSRMIFRHLLVRRSAIRFYHNEAKPEFRYVDKRPQVKVANSRILRTLRDRRHAESQPNAPWQKDPNVKFEPFPFQVTEENRFEHVKRAVTPLHDVPYEEQLSTKESYCRNALRLLGQELYKSGTPVRLDVRRLPCRVSSIVPSPVLERFRNKDEFSIWHGYDGKTLTVGYMIFPISKHGDTVCVEPNAVCVMKDESIKMTDLVQEFMRQQAKLGICKSLGTEGGWRRFLVRVNVDGELMLIGHLSPRALKVRQVLEERDNFKDFIVRRSQEEGLKLVSLYYQPCPNNKCYHRDVPFELLHGSPTIVEKVGSIKVHLSPESYIHNSTPGAQALFDSVRQSIKDCFPENYDDAGSAKPLIINVDCGAGALALYLADMATDVVGIDRNERSIDDARLNVKLNEAKNVEFVAADTEVVLERVLEKHRKKAQNGIIVVTDMSTLGLHNNVIQVLRDCRDVNRIVLILPKLDSMKIMKNVMDLCLKAGSRSLAPFAPILAVPVDTCPQTQAFQTILVLERLPE